MAAIITRPGNTDKLLTPDFDSGFLAIAQGFPLTINHALGGDIDDYLVVLDLNNNVAKTAEGIYLLNEVSGTNVPDTSGNGFDLTTVNMEDGDWVAGLINNALNFDGVDEHTISSDATEFNFDNTDPFSLVSWIYPIYDGTSNIIFGKMGAGPAFQGYQWFVNPSGFIFMQLISDFAVPDHHSMTTKKAVEFSTWTHVAFTYNGNRKSSGTNQYLNGKITPTEVTREEAQGVGSIVNSIPFQISGRNGATATFFGMIDMAFVFAREITETEVDWLYNNGTGREVHLGQSGNLLGTHGLNKNNTSRGTHIESIDNANVLIRRSIHDPITDRVRIRIWDLS